MNKVCDPSLLAVCMATTEDVFVCWFAAAAAAAGHQGGARTGGLPLYLMSQTTPLLLSLAHRLDLAHSPASLAGPWAG